MSRHTVAEAADMLGITTGAVRNRLSRGTLGSVKEEGTVYVLLPADTPRDAARDAGDTPSADRLYQEMSERIAYLERQVEEEREARRRADTLLARLMDRIPELEAPQETSGGPETVEEEPERAEPRSYAPSPQRPAERPWWRRVFGGG
jgi:hypothetical protein